MDTNGFRYFKKEIPDNPLFLPTGAKVDFQFFDPEGFGFLQTADEFVIAELDRAISRRVGGVVESSVEEYDEFQKKKAEQPLGRLSRPEREAVTAQTLNRFRFRSNGTHDAAVRAAADSRGIALPPAARTAVQHPIPERLEVPTEFPTLGSAVLPNPPPK